MIDDLGDRDLLCDLLLDQNPGASAEKYEGKAPKNCKLILGPRYALLRNEFSEWRELSLNRRIGENIENVLITMGGADAEDYTFQVLKQIMRSKNAKNCAFTVIIG